MQGDEFVDLVQDIKANGLLEWVWVTPAGELLDGRNRVRACIAAGVAVQSRVYEGDDPVAFAISLNLKRRHLTTGQRAAIAADLVPVYAAEAKQRQGHRSDLDQNIEADLPQCSSRGPQARDQAAAAVGVSGRAVSQFKRLAAVDTSLADDVRAGRVPLNKAEAKARAIEGARRAESEQDSRLQGIIARLDAGEIIVVNMRDDLTRALEARGYVARIDRGTPWGNPYVLGEDGDRTTVIDNYERHYLEWKPSLTSKLQTLRGKALGCWCAPEPCHGDVLRRWAQ
jgi:ParB-like chromosome segregation protein Spo0J